MALSTDENRISIITHNHITVMQHSIAQNQVKAFQHGRLNSETFTILISIMKYGVYDVITSNDCAKFGYNVFSGGSFSPHMGNITVSFPVQRRDNKPVKTCLDWFVALQFKPMGIDFYSQRLKWAIARFQSKDMLSGSHSDGSHILGVTPPPKKKTKKKQNKNKMVVGRHFLRTGNLN